jgi:hypothetical protein
MGDILCTLQEPWRLLASRGGNGADDLIVNPTTSAHYVDAGNAYGYKAVLKQLLSAYPLQRSSTRKSVIYRPYLEVPTHANGCLVRTSVAHGTSADGVTSTFKLWGYDSYDTDTVPSNAFLGTLLLSFSATGGTVWCQEDPQGTALAGTSRTFCDVFTEVQNNCAAILRSGAANEVGTIQMDLRGIRFLVGDFTLGSATDAWTFVKWY